MATPTLEELKASAEDAHEPILTSRYVPSLGGVDPLGLRQINFDLMDQVIPGLNNVAHHIRPFTVVTWAWWRAAHCADEQGMANIDVDLLKDFVDRVEVIYVWSQFVRDPNADLPGQDVLAPLVNAEKYEFNGKAWAQRRYVRTNSTALSAPINYGPALKALGWLQSDPEGSGALVPTLTVIDAVKAFETLIADRLKHPAFFQFGPVEVTGVEVRSWADAWAWNEPTREEQLAMAETLSGAQAPTKLKAGVGLAVAAMTHCGAVTDTDVMRQTMCGAPTSFDYASDIQAAWRTVQVRQAFRFALEALLFWILRQLDDGPKTTKVLANMFLDAAGTAETSEQWLSNMPDATIGPTDWINRVQEGLKQVEHPTSLPDAIRGALAACIDEAPDDAGSERSDRLPLAQAAKEANGWRETPPSEFMAHVIDSWIFGQHVYWAVGRGLGDARARGKTLLRLKVVLEEEGWALAPGVNVAPRNAPKPTADRLETALSLMGEANLLPSGTD